MRLSNVNSAITLALVWPTYLLLLAVPSTSFQSVRLAGSPVNVTGVNEGRVEIFHEGEWKDVCHRRWDHQDAEVVCRQIGFSSATFAMVESYYGSGRNNGSVQNFDCEGDEQYLEQCSFKTASKTCRDGETAGVSCFLPGYLGCFLDRTVGSVLNGDYFSSDDMTVRKCLQFCYNKKLRYAGLRQNTECYCGTNGTAYDAWGSLSNTNCMLHCAGNHAEACGGQTTWFWTTSVYDVDLARCPKPDEPSFGFVKETGAFWYGSTATFDCYTGFEVEEAHTLSCVLGDEVDELVWRGEPTTCTEIPEPTSRNKEEERNRIFMQAKLLKGTKGSVVKLKDKSSTRLIIGALIGFIICVVIAISVFIVCRKERKEKRSPKIRKQEEGNGRTTGYQLAHGVSASTSDSKI
ncbi:scavenger receptor cysteine-rich domain superfamily protein-like [Acanthaster planci]|uniref:Scavenger receptor cysteine-rich domain superfamily protein-like n=1 Tax=Acanthaster planci TaxID=133434 RepID=A0A8B7Z1H1_ACAPL|nr:scavenger receptor cysteine-rich domain superfamily protein-like [Acanthaster planci]